MTRKMLREEDQKEVEGAGQVIAEQGDEIDAEPHFKGIEWTAAGQDHLPQAGEKRRVLVMHVDDHAGFVPEGPHAEKGVGQAHAGKRQDPRHHRIEPDAVFHRPVPPAPHSLT